MFSVMRIHNKFAVLLIHKKDKMKTKMKKSLLVVFMFGTFINYASENKNYNSIAKNNSVEKKVTIEFTNLNTVFFEPIIKIRNKKNLVYISKENSSKESVKVTIYYYNEIIYSKTFKSTEKLKVFRLLESETGSYKIIVKSEGKSFIKNFEI